MSPQNLRWNTYMREYMRRKNPGRKPRKEIYEAKRLEFRHIVSSGGYGSVTALASRVGIVPNTACKWLLQMRDENRTQVSQAERN